MTRIRSGDAESNPKAVSCLRVPLVSTCTSERCASRDSQDDPDTRCLQVGKIGNMRLVAALAKALVVVVAARSTTVRADGNDGRQSVPFGNRSHRVGSIAPRMPNSRVPDIGNFDLPRAVADDSLPPIAQRPVIQCDDVALITERCFAVRWLALLSAALSEHARSAIENPYGHNAGAASVVGLDRDIDACSILLECPPPSLLPGSTVLLVR